LKDASRLVTRCGGQSSSDEASLPSDTARRAVPHGRPCGRESRNFTAPGPAACPAAAACLPGPAASSNAGASSPKLHRSSSKDALHLLVCNLEGQASGAAASASPGARGASVL
jgi:hypothetical protein